MIRIIVFGGFCLISFAIFSQTNSSSCASSELIIDTSTGPTPWTSLNLNNDDCQFQFAIVTDRTGGHRPGVFLDGIKKLNLLQPEFVMSVGDLIEGYTEDQDQLKKEWDEFEGFIDHLEMPFFYLPGNHDITNKVMEKVWNQRFGKSYYHFIYKDVLFLCLNSEDQAQGAGKGSISEKQYEYAKKVLEENEQVRWTLVFMHQPLWIQKEDPFHWADIESLLAEREHHVFVGHYHSYVKYERNQGKYFILATTGGGSGLRGPQLGEFDHVVWVTMTKEGPIMANLLLDGIWDENVMTAKRKQQVNNLLRGDMIRIMPIYSETENFKDGYYLFKLTNNEDIPLKVDIREGFSWDMQGKAIRNQVTIAPNSVEMINVLLENKTNKAIDALKPMPIHFNFNYDSPEAGSLKIPISYEIKPVLKRYVEKIQKPITVDGLLDEWSDFPVHYRDRSSSDNEVKISITQDDQYLYLASYITDDTLIVDPTSSVWKQDSFNWEINSEDSKTIANSRSVQRLRMTPAFNGLPAQMHNAKDLPGAIKWASSAVEGGYSTEVAIPIKLIEERSSTPWEQIRVNFFVDDKDQKDQAPARFYWHPDWRNQGSWVGSGLFFNRD